MAERRMFNRKITDDDNFIKLSASAQALYLHLSMSADDDGFSNQVTLSMFRAHASVQDLEALLEKRYIYQFDNGVIVIKHWRMANALRKDRYTPTNFKEQLELLELDENGAYTMRKNEWLPDGCQSVANRLPQDRLGKDSIDKVSLGKDKEHTHNNNISICKPTLDELEQYMEQEHLDFDSEKFIAYYDATGWMVGNSPMVDWRAVAKMWSYGDEEKANG